MDDTDTPPEDTESDVIEQNDDEELEEELDEFGDDVEEEEEEEEPDDLDEVEIDGKTYKVPKEAALRQADYTRKTMELAEQRKAVEATLESLTRTSEQEASALSNLANIRAQIDQYKDVDWAAWSAQDPVAALSHRQQFMELQQMSKDALQEYQDAKQQVAAIAQQETDRRLEKGHKELVKRIPGWNAEKAQSLRNFAISDYGFSAEEIDSLDNPLAVLVLHDAMEARMSRKQAATTRKLEKQQAVTPAKTVKGGGTVPKTGLDDRLSADEWVRRRNAQVAKRNR